MTHLALFASAFFTVFLLGFQQKNVHGEHYLAAVVTSFGIGAAQIFLWRLVPDATASQIAATLMGGPVGIVAAMRLHPIIMRRRTAQPSPRRPSTTPSPTFHDERAHDFIKSLLDPERNGWSVSKEVRNAARKVLQG